MRFRVSEAVPGAPGAAAAADWGARAGHPVELAPGSRRANVKHTTDPLNNTYPHHTS